ncbi:MAG: hypothetical protein DYG92_10355 [Leptolyngbya sp. PLA1]|nr:hypothetical protein [Leptolyngbya sp. PLA1]
MRDSVRLTAAISGDLTGSVDCGTVYRLQVGGAIKAPVTAASPNDPSTNAAIAVISAGALQNNGSDTHGAIAAGAGNIGFVQVGQVGAAGDLEGPVHAPQGRIASVSVIGDVLIADPIGIRARNGIDSIDAGSVISAIVANNGATTLGPALKHLHCSELLGDVEADYIAPCDGCDVTENAITITGPWSGSLTVRGDVLAHIHQQGSQSGTVSIDVLGSIAATVRTESKIEVLHVDGAFADLNDIGSITLQCLNGEGIGAVYVGGNFGRPDVPMLLSADFVGRAEFGGHFSGRIRATSGGPCAVSELSVGGDITLDDHQTWSGVRRLDCGGIFYPGGYSLHLADSPPDLLMRVGSFLETGANEDQVRISPSGLQGQVILNAAGTYPPPEGWYGQFALSGSSSYLHRLSPSRDQPDEAPYYQRRSSDFGGGAIGTVPFALHLEDCDPPLTAPLYDEQNPGADRTFLTSAFGQRPYGSGECPQVPTGGSYPLDSVLLRFYGPIRAESTTTPVHVYLDDGAGQPNTAFDFAAEGLVEAAILPPQAGDYSRLLRIRGVTTQGLSQGVYHVMPRTDEGARLLCDGLLSPNVAIPVLAFDYVFQLEVDCNHNGVNDLDDIAADWTLDIWPDNDFIDCCEPCDPDYNQDGNVDQGDVDYIINIVSGGENPTGAPGDFNHDGNADQDDIAALINTVGGGGCP